MSAPSVAEELGPTPTRTAAVVGSMDAYTPGGVYVTLSVEPDPPRAGSIRLRFRLDPVPADPSTVTVDVVAPRMPMHGIVRFPARPTSKGSFVSDIDIPMKGLWAVYVNLDEGREAASVEFDVDAGDGGPIHERHQDAHRSRDDEEPGQGLHLHH